MIIQSEKYNKDLSLQVVNGDHIMKTYQNNKLVSSCMSNADRWKRVKFLSYVEGANLFRIMRGKDVVLRSLLWVSGDIKLLDKVYFKSYPYDYCSQFDQIESYPKIWDIFLEVWKDFATNRDTVKHLKLPVASHKLSAYPMLDTFRYLNRTKTELSNRPNGGYVLTDHIGGRLY